MQRFSFCFVVLVAFLCFGCKAFSVDPIEISSPSTPALPKTKPLPTTTSPSVEKLFSDSFVAREPDKVNPESLQQPHIALLLPLKSSSFAKAADAVRRGFEAANFKDPPSLPIKIYSTDETVDNILLAYHQAINLGAIIVVGPLTRNAVSVIASMDYVRAPTLALNVVEDNLKIPHGLFLFGLQAESEARQIAQFAFGVERRKSIIIVGNSTLEKRIQHAFSDEWEKLGGTVQVFTMTGTDRESLTSLRQVIAGGPSTALFLALDAIKARALRPYLTNNLSIFATSIVYSSRNDKLANFDLDGVQFVDMPWLLEPDHPAVMIYQRPSDNTSADLERLYALGIDAYRIAQNLILQFGRANNGGLELDGVTGRIKRDDQNTYVRQLTPAIFSHGEVVPISSIR